MHPGPRLAESHLAETVQQYYSEGLAASTKKVYSTGQKHFMKFCSEYYIQNVLPVDEDVLCYFVAYLGKQGLGHGTIKSYLAAVRSLQIDYGFHNPFDKNMPKLDCWIGS